jgi:hypothetical protein
MEAVNNMSVDKSRKIDHEVKEIHSQIKRSNLVLRQRMKDIQQELVEWDSLGGTNDDESEGITE